MHIIRTSALVTATAAVLALAACSGGKQQNPSGNQFERGANTMAQGAKQIATGVKDVASDSVITAHVKARLAANQGLSSFDIHVATRSGVVTLTGKVGSEAARKLAVQIAGTTRGVRVVIDKLTVKGAD